MSSASLVESRKPISLPRPPRANVLGVGVHALDLSMAADIVCAAAKRGHRGYVCVTSVHGVMEAQRDPMFRGILSRAFLVTPDGMPTVWVGHFQGHAQMSRVFGPDLMMEICARSANNGIRQFFYGGKPGVADELAQNLRLMFSNISIAGSLTPPFRDLTASEHAALQRQMAAACPDIVWVGLSTPKQERFMAANIDRLSCKIMIGVGAAFDIHTGHLKDAPAWIKSAGLQWAHRLCQEPRRLWKRYLVNNLTFLTAVIQQLIGMRRYPLPSTSSGPPFVDQQAD